jgi:predicted transcriptional regulator
MKDLTKDMKALTKAEEQIMQYLWKIKKGFLKDIVEVFPEPKPAYTTISTVIRILVKKGYVGYTAYSKVHEYYPLVSKNEYFKVYFNGILKNYFSSSVESFTSFFTNENDLSLSELEDIKHIIDEQIKKHKG